MRDSTDKELGVSEVLRVSGKQPTLCESRSRGRGEQKGVVVVKRDEKPERWVLRRLLGDH